eukprot:g38187.t1
MTFPGIFPHGLASGRGPGKSQYWKNRSALSTYLFACPCASVIFRHLTKSAKLRRCCAAAISLAKGKAARDKAEKLARQQKRVADVGAYSSSVSSLTHAEHELHILSSSCSTSSGSDGSSQPSVCSLYTYGSGHSRARIDEKIVSAEHAKRLKKSRDYQARKRAVQVVEAEFPSDEELQAMLLSSQRRAKFPKNSALLETNKAQAAAANAINEIVREMPTRSAHKQTRLKAKLVRCQRHDDQYQAQRSYIQAKRLEDHMAEAPDSVPSSSAAAKKLASQRSRTKKAKKSNFSGLRKGRLPELCRELGLSPDGTVADLRKRLEDHMAEAPDSVPSSSAAASSQAAKKGGRKGAKKGAKKGADKQSASQSSSSQRAVESKRQQRAAAKGVNYEESDAEEDGGSDYEDPTPRWHCTRCNHPNPWAPGDSEFAGCVFCDAFAAEEESSEGSDDMSD